MPADADQCRTHGCTRPRTQHSVFCDQHHEEQLGRFGVVRLPAHDPSEDLRRRCKNVLKWHEVGVITREEQCGQLYDHFVHAHFGAPAGLWDKGLDTLPPEVLADLLAYVKEHPPHLFNPRSIELQRRAAQDRDALLARTNLIARLEEKAAPRRGRK